MPTIEVNAYPPTLNMKCCPCQTLTRGRNAAGDPECDVCRQLALANAHSDELWEFVAYLVDPRVGRVRGVDSQRHILIGVLAIDAKPLVEHHNATVATTQLARLQGLVRHEHAVRAAWLAENPCTGNPPPAALVEAEAATINALPKGSHAENNG